MIHICRRGAPVEGGSPECHRRARKVKTGGREVANIVGEGDHLREVANIVWGEDHHRGTADIMRTGHRWKAKSSVRKDHHTEGEDINEREVGTEAVAMREIQREMREELGNVRMENLQRILLLNF